MSLTEEQFAKVSQMQQFGATETWTPEECEMMWRRFNGNEDMGDDDTGNS